ncbi:MAG: hypothetical protein AABZ47_14760 [Planctomycetota bacterium]
MAGNIIESPKQVLILDNSLGTPSEPLEKTVSPLISSSPKKGAGGLDSRWIIQASSLRLARIAAIRDQILHETYETFARIEATVDRLLKEI